MSQSTPSPTPAKSLIDRINDAWERAGKPPHLASRGRAAREARRLDAQLSVAILPHIEQWERGLISAVEFVQAVVAEASKEE